MQKGPSWSWSYGSQIYSYLCNQCLSQLMLWVRIPLMARCAQYNIMWYSLIVTCDSRGFSPGTTVFSINKPDRHDITEILLKVALSTITLTLTPLNCAVGSLSIQRLYILNAAHVIYMIKVYQLIIRGQLYSYIWLLQYNVSILMKVAKLII